MKVKVSDSIEEIYTFRRSGRTPGRYVAAMYTETRGGVGHLSWTCQHSHGVSGEAAECAEKSARQKLDEPVSLRDCIAELTGARASE